MAHPVGPGAACVLVVFLAGCPESHTDADGYVGPDAAIDVAEGDGGDPRDGDAVGPMDVPTDATSSEDVPAVVDGGHDILDAYRAACARFYRAACLGAGCCERFRLPLGPCPWLHEDGCGMISRDDPAFAALTDGTVRLASGLEEYLGAVEAAAPTCGSRPSASFSDFLVGDIDEGGDCTPTSTTWAIEAFRCRPGLFCSLTGPAAGGWRGECLPAAGLGGPCLSDAACAPGLYCRALDAPETEAFRGRCRAQLASGEACDDDGQCGDGICIDLCTERTRTDDWCDRLYGRGPG